MWKSKYNLIVLGASIVALSFLLLRTSFDYAVKCGEQRQSEFVKVQIGDGMFEISKQLAQYMMYSDHKDDSGKPLLKPFNRVILCPKDQYFKTEIVKISFYGMKDLNRNNPESLPIGLEYLDVYGTPLYESYTSFPQEDSQTYGVSHYRCDRDNSERFPESCRIYKAHSSIPVHFELRAKITKSFLGQPNPDNSWYPKEKWPELVSEIEDVLMSMSPSLEDN